MTIGPVLHEMSPVRCFQRRQRLGPTGKIHRTPVVGIDQRQVPEFCSLIEIGHARHRRLQRDLAERIQRAEQRKPLRQRRH
jgi:hypothetical protein